MFAHRFAHVRSTEGWQQNPHVPRTPPAMETFQLHRNFWSIMFHSMAPPRRVFNHVSLKLWALSGRWDVFEAPFLEVRCLKKLLKNIKACRVVVCPFEVPNNDVDMHNPTTSFRYKIRQSHSKTQKPERLCWLYACEPRKKLSVTFHEILVVYYLLNRDPYFMVYKIIPI